MSGGKAAKGKGRLVLYLGGIRSGKSALAQERVAAFTRRGGAVAYLATWPEPPRGKADPERERRVRLHRQSRPAGWTTLEAWRGLVEALKAVSKGAPGRGAGAFRAILLDGTGLFVSNAMAWPENRVLDQAEVFCLSCRHQAALTVVVADEVGQGGVPGHPVARRFADLNGKFNQALARAADEVWWVAAGTAFRTK